MLARTVTHALVGLDPRRVEVEAHLQRGVPGFAIVGLADRACQEAKERVRSGIASAELEWPLRRITVNLAPADLKKEGSGFDLPIALAVLAARVSFHSAASKVMPRLGSSRSTGACVRSRARSSRRKVRGGTAPGGSSAPRIGARRSLWPGWSRLRFVISPRLLPISGASEGPRQPADITWTATRASAVPDLADVRGQERARRAFEIAAAGRAQPPARRPAGDRQDDARTPPAGHPPAARRRGGARGDAYSLGRRASCPAGAGLIRTPPFRAPHHTASTASVVGGGSTPRPGEVTLAHRGVLLLDELPEFPRPVLGGAAPAARGRHDCDRPGRRPIVFPSRFQLVGTMNLCPCGARGDPAARVLLLAASGSTGTATALARPARPLRPRGRTSASARDRARGPARRGLGRRPRTRDGARESASPWQSLPARRRSRRAARAGGRAAAAVRARPRAGRARRAHDRRARGSRAIGAEHVAEALSYRSPSELAAR